MVQPKGEAAVLEQCNLECSGDMGFLSHSYDRRHHSH